MMLGGNNCHKHTVVTSISTINVSLCVNRGIVATCTCMSSIQRLLVLSQEKETSQ